MSELSEAASFGRIVLEDAGQKSEEMLVTTQYASGAFTFIATGMIVVHVRIPIFKFSVQFSNEFKSLQLASFLKRISNSYSLSQTV